MNPLLISALLGGVTGAAQAYGQSKGDLGQTLTGGLIGGGLGAVLPGAASALGTRLAGTALGAKVAPEAYKASQLLARSGASTINPIGQQVLGKAALAKGLGIGALAAGGLAIPALAAGGAGVAGQAVSGISKAAGLTGQATGMGQADMPGVPNVPNADLTPFNAPNLAQTFDPFGSQMAQLALQDEQYRRNMLSALRYAPYQEAYTQRSKEADLVRGAKAAQLATALQTDAAMRQQGQLGAQRMAEGFLSNVGQAMAQQYRYF